MNGPSVGSIWLSARTRQVLVVVVCVLLLALLLKDRMSTPVLQTND